MNKLTKDCVEWIRDYFVKTNNCNAVVGISGGKDSTVVAALCKEALGKDRVFGVLMPDGVQKDIEDSKKVCAFLGIKNGCIDISSAVKDIRVSVFNSGLVDNIMQQTKYNLPPRIRMATLYAVAQSVNGRVVGTGNLSERMLGWTTLWGDSVSDLNPIGNLYVHEVIEVGRDLGLPEELIVKPPSDGLTGKTDEDNLGFTYDMFYKHMMNITNNNHMYDIDRTTEDKIETRIDDNSWKMHMTNIPMFVPKRLN